jgi:subtilisin family serine protease
MANAQTHINKEWETTSGNPMALDWTASLTNASNQLISIGNSYVAGQGANILTTKYNKDGSIAWQRNHNTTGTQNDYGIALATDDNDNIYVAGTTDNAGFTNYDVVVLKYNAVGALQWSRTFNTAFSKNDVGTGIKVDVWGNIYVCGASEGATTGTDYLLLKYDASGTLQWNGRYDYAALTELAVGIDVDAAGNPFIIGASASAANNWDFTIAKFDASGVYQNDVRNALPGVGFDQPLGYKKDGAGNIYITGKSSTDGVNYDIKTVKFNPSFVLQWTKIIDFAGKEDVANSIDIDAIGNVYIGGYTTKANDKKEAFAVKYNGNGNEVWRHEQSAINTTGDAIIKAIDVTPTGEVYFVGQEKGTNGSEDVIVSKISTLGSLEWQKKLAEAVDEKPTNVKVADDGSVYVTALKGGAGNTYETVRYTEFKISGNVIYNATTGEPVCKANELIVRFQREALNINAIDDNIGTKKAEYGDLDYFLTSAAMDSVNNALAPLCSAPTTSHHAATATNPCGIKAVKVFPDTKTTDMTTISRLGETIKIPDFWTALLLEFPDGMDIQQVDSVLSSIQGVVRYADINYIVQPATPCNDPQYNVQRSLHSTPAYPNADINVEEAWEVMPDAGASFIKCGVFDSGIEWRHEDFGYDGNAYSSAVVTGWNFYTNTNVRDATVTDVFGHGTAVAGIIGALRNNTAVRNNNTVNIGIAGVAGGNGNDGGISLYDLKIFDDYGQFFGGNTLYYISRAIIESAKSSDLQPYHYGLNLSNNSWLYREGQAAPLRDEYNRNLLVEAVHFANRAKVTFVAARGNDGINNRVIPANIDDDWVLSVGGTGSDGKYKTYENDPNSLTDFAASYGTNLDIAAPASKRIVRTTAIGNSYISEGGTSLAAPHVAGVVGLMMSYINAPTPAYQNLAPEDCENIIQLSATVLNGERYNEKTGYGRLNAGKALKLIQRPNNAVLHFGTTTDINPTINIQLVELETAVRLGENYTNEAGVTFNHLNPNGTEAIYFVNKYKVDAVLHHSFPAANIRAYWARPSSSTVLDEMPIWGSGTSFLPRERVKINACNNTICSMTGYVYQLLRLDGATNDLVPTGQWWPANYVANPSLAKFEYTILATNDVISATNNAPTSDKDISVYPNPSGAENTLQFSCDKEQPFEINLFNIQGQFIQQVSKGTTREGMNKLTSNVENLTSGMYLYELKVGSSIAHTKFIKQ